jgi:hypothetical protein
LGLGNAAMKFGSGVAGLFDAGPEIMAGGGGASLEEALMLAPLGLATGGLVHREHHGDNTTGDSNVAGGQNLGGADADPIEAMWPRLIKQESGGKQFDPETGKPLTSSAGAVGIAQVMPGTAPEAAKLAGLDYDEDRYRNDPEYNAALGKAYLKDQYRKFGDPQLAAAAYNAGPGAVQKAQQKAQESGQSIMSYLPQETQNYVASIFGGSPAGQAIQRAAPSPQGGMGAASPSGDTSQPGFFDNIGLNRQTLVPLLQGLAGMAGSKSRYLGSAILEGLGAGAKSYGEQQDQQAALLGKNIENVQNLYNNWRSVNYLNPMPFSQYAAAVGYKGPIPPSLMGGPFAGTAGAGAGSARPSIGSPAAIGTANVQDLISAYQNNAVTDYNGTKVSAQNDPVFLSRLRAALAPVASTDKIAAGMYAEAGNKLSEINGRGNMTYDVSGQQVPVPGSLEAGTEAVGIAQSVKNYANEVGKSTAALQGLQQSQNVIDNMKDAYKNFQAGPGSAPLARTNALINTVNANFGTKIGSVGDKDAANPTAYYTALKEAANSVSSQFANVPGIAGAPKAGINLFESGTPNPDMAPGAIHHVMSQMEANVELANRWYSGLQDPEFRNKYGNINNYQKQFLSNPENQLSNIQQNKYDAIGPLKGEIPIIKTPEALSSVKGSNDFILGEGFDKSVQGENVKGMTARVVRNDEELRAAVNEAKRAQKKIAIIPTYGNMANQIGVVQ